MPPQTPHRDIAGSPYHVEEAVPLHHRERKASGLKQEGSKGSNTSNKRSFLFSRPFYVVLLLAGIYAIVSASLLLSPDEILMNFSFLRTGHEIHEGEQFLTHYMAQHLQHHDNNDNHSTPKKKQQEASSVSLETARSLLAHQRIPGVVLSSNKPGMKEYQWWIVDEQALFVSISCGDGAASLYFSTGHVALGATPCSVPVPPKTWSLMESVVVQHLGHHEGIRRVDLKANDETVYLVNIVSHDDRNGISLLPPILKTLLRGVQDGRDVVTSALLTPRYMEQVVNADSWVLLDRSQSPSVKAVAATTHFSAEDLCHDEAAAPNASNNQQLCPNSDMTTVQEDFSIRCVSVQDHDITKAVGQWRITTIETVMVRVDWPWALGLVAVLVLLTVTGMGNKEQSVPVRCLVIGTYLAIVVLYKYVQPSNTAFLSPQSISTTVVESFHAFVAVHPFASQLVVWSHIATYWFEVQAWRSKSLKGILLWYLMYELVASFVNEYTHSMEEDLAVRCTRVSFIGDMKQYAIDDVVRAYLLPPFFCYGYLLPKLILHYMQL